MKTTKTIKEGLIKISRHEKIYLTIRIIPFIMLLIYALIINLIPIGPLQILLCLLFFSIPMVFTSTIQAIRRKDEKIIRQNKLINVILSDKYTVSDYFINLFFILLFATLMVIYRFRSFWIILLMLPVTTFCSYKLGKIISKYFEKKLSK